MSDRPTSLEIVAPLFRVRRGLRVQFRARVDELKMAQVSGSPIARHLALGHRLVRAVEAGEVDSFSELAKRMGVSRAWISMLVELTFLAPDLQLQLLTTPLSGSMRMTDLLSVARLPEWHSQRQRWGELKT